MSRPLSSDEENDLFVFYRQSTIIIDYFSKIKPKLISSDVNFQNLFSNMKLATESTYRNKDYRGMKMIIKDMKEMFKGCKTEDKKEINNLFEQNNLPEW